MQATQKWRPVVFDVHSSGARGKAARVPSSRPRTAWRRRVGAAVSAVVLVMAVSATRAQMRQGRRWEPIGDPEEAAGSTCPTTGGSRSRDCGSRPLPAATTIAGCRHGPTGIRPPSGT